MPINITTTTTSSEELVTTNYATYLFEQVSPDTDFTANVTYNTEWNRMSILQYKFTGLNGAPEMIKLRFNNIEPHYDCGNVDSREVFLVYTGTATALHGNRNIIDQTYKWGSIQNAKNMNITVLDHENNRLTFDTLYLRIKLDLVV